MSELPRKEIPPLEPPRGQLDAVLSQARERRYRRAGTTLLVATVFVAGLAGGVALDRPVTEVPADLLRYASSQLGDGNESASPTQPADSASPLPRETPRQERAAAPPADRPTASAEQSPAPLGPLAVNLRVVGVGGEPAAGLYVYPGELGADGFVPAAEPAGRTAQDGSFTLPCTGTPVLLTPWRLNSPLERSGGAATWAATFAGGVTQPGSALAPDCSRRGRPSTTIVQPGATVTGTVAIAPSCDATTASLRLRLFDDPALRVRLDGFTDGDRYAIGGLPSGRHSLGVAGQRSPLTTVGTEPVTRDVAVTCEPEPQPSPTPEPTSAGPTPPEPTPTPTTPSPTTP